MTSSLGSTFSSGLFGSAVVFLSLVFSPNLAASAPSPTNETTKELLIVTPEMFVSALGPFLDHKHKRLPTRVQSLETILARSEGVDDPERLKRFLYDAWRHGGLGYVLLVGDVDLMPVRYMVLDRVTPTAFDYAFYPSDLYYSDLARKDGSFDDWNSQKEAFHAAYFGEVRGEKNKDGPINFDRIDYLPDVAVGRWPVSTLNELRCLMEKTIAFETTLSKTPSFPPLAAFFAVGGWVDSRPLMHRLAGFLTNNWQIEKRFYSDPASEIDTPPPDHRELRALLNRGLSLAVHTGHGQADAWEQCFSLKDLAAITNAATLPVFISAGCSTACFAPLPPYEAYVDVHGNQHAGTDNREVFNEPPPPPAAYQRGRFNPTGLGEQTLKRDLNGGVAYIGCNTGSQPCALTLLEGFVESLATHPRPRLGDCWAAAIHHYYNHERLASLKPTRDWYPPSVFFQGMKFMVFGDPSLELPGSCASE